MKRAAMTEGGGFSKDPLLPVLSSYRGSFESFLDDISQFWPGFLNFV